ncbi:hypothetical protein C8T65DRAFT_788717, partial [Cerioporus squamosus]
QSGTFPEFTDGLKVYHGLKVIETFGPRSRSSSLKAHLEVLRDGGACMNPFAVFLLQDLEDLSLRAQRHSDNALILAQWLEKHPKVSRDRGVLPGARVAPVPEGDPPPPPSERLWRDAQFRCEGSSWRRRTGPQRGRRLASAGEQLAWPTSAMRRRSSSILPRRRMRSESRPRSGSRWGFLQTSSA